MDQISRVVVEVGVEKVRRCLPSVGVVWCQVFTVLEIRECPHFLGSKIFACD